MPIVPIALKIDADRRCLVVGGGWVALRKVAWLFGCGAPVDVIAPEIVNEIIGLADDPAGAIRLFREPYQSRDLSGYGLAIAATHDEAINARVAEDARRARVPVNVVDRPELCTFFIPATVWRGDLQVAVSTGGACPSLAGRLRQEFDAVLPDWYGDYTAALGTVRREIMQNAGGGMRSAEMPLGQERRALMAFLASREVAENLKDLDLEGMKKDLRQRAENWLAERRQHKM